MKAAVLRALGSPLTIEELLVPEPGEGQVLVRVVASGVCHTQLLEVRGMRGPDRYLPHTLGHEGAGIVLETGRGVTRVAPGDRVILSWMKGVGADPHPPVYRSRGEAVSSGSVTTFQEQTLASENRVTKVRADMPLDKAALIGCAAATGAGAVIHTAGVKPGSTIAVFGAGGIGLFAVQAATLLHAARVIAIDVQEKKLALARALGATDAVDARASDSVEALLALTGGRGVDVAIEAAGRRETMEQAFRAVRTKGGIAVLVGNLASGTPISIDPFALIAGKRIVGSWGGDTDPDRDFPLYVDLYMSGKLKLDELITHRFPLEDVNRALDTLERGEAGRIILDLA